MSLKPKYKKIGFLILCLSNLDSLWAASCHSGGGGQVMNVLVSDQRYQLGGSTQYRSVEGQFDPYGHYSANSPGTSKQSYVTTVGGAFRINDEWQVGASLPMIHNDYAFSTQHHTATNMGDPALEARYLFWEDLNFLTFHPEVSFYGGARLPLGNSIHHSHDTYDADVTGDGTTTLHGGISVSKLYRPVRLSFDSAFFYPMTKHVTHMHDKPVSSPYAMKAGNRIQTTEGMTYLFNGWSSSLGLKQMWQFETSVDGQDSQGSAARLFSSQAGLNYFYAEFWTVGISYETSFPFYKYEVNQPYAQTVALSITYSAF
ncbi:MAG: hypothetical protein A2X86_06225 [Bdellovibrionales bacterium GWA2_49_15]|nr:MAG: hypothetical protein A2X86_06225 [Bdellovibrionales bacterium GWA2_49_15]HAZ14659.1 hypothetical protein [Bdellovibrionales bacterium]